MYDIWSHLKSDTCYRIIDRGFEISTKTAL